MGTLVSRRQYDRVLGHLRTAVGEGAEVLTGGGRQEPRLGAGPHDQVHGLVHAFAQLAHVRQQHVAQPWPGPASDGRRREGRAGQVAAPVVLDREIPVEEY
jgi:hypothetical protein